MTLVIASVAGAAGAVARYLVSGWAQERVRLDFPAGTLIVNVVGAFALGLMIGGGFLDSPPTLTVVGFLGGFTTFSTWMVETIRLGPLSASALANVTLMLGLGVAAAALGYILTG